MKLVFTKLETPATEIKVAFDDVNYKSYNVDLTKIKIQGKLSTLGSVEVKKNRRIRTW